MNRVRRSKRPVRSRVAKRERVCVCAKVVAKRDERGNSRCMEEMRESVCVCVLCVCVCRVRV